MVIFHSYVSLPEGKFVIYISLYIGGEVAGGGAITFMTSAVDAMLEISQNHMTFQRASYG